MSGRYKQVLQYSLKPALSGRCPPEGARNWGLARISEIQWLVDVQSQSV